MLTLLLFSPLISFLQALNPALPLSKSLWSSFLTIYLVCSYLLQAPVSYTCLISFLPPFFPSIPIFLPHSLRTATLTYQITTAFFLNLYQFFFQFLIPASLPLSLFFILSSICASCPLFAIIMYPRYLYSFTSSIFPLPPPVCRFPSPSAFSTSHYFCLLYIQLYSFLLYIPFYCSHNSFHFFFIFCYQCQVICICQQVNFLGSYLYSSSSPFL